MNEERLPRIIQGGMGVAVSDWRLARTVSRLGQLGTVSGTAVDLVCARRLQLGDPGGHLRRALARFPIPEMADQVVRTFYVPGGKRPGTPFRPVPRYSLRPGRALVALTIVANFAEVYLAKEGHDGRVGVNYLRKIELPIPFACYGALLAGADHILMGAGNPAELPALLDRLAAHRPVALPVRVQGATSADGDTCVEFDPAALWDRPPALRRPRFEAIVASVDLAAALAADPASRPDGFVVEGPPAGGHNAPPRGPRHLDASGQPVYGERDVVEPAEMAAIGLPFWMAGGYGGPDGLAAALAGGAAGIQAGTAFAFCAESGMAAPLKQAVLGRVAREGARVRTDARVSPTGFPFKVVDLEGTVSREDVYADRPRLCDLGVLRSPYRKPDGTVGYRCPAEPVEVYQQRRGGRVQNTEGRRCLCNALLATAGYAQERPGGYAEPAIVTCGTDLTAVRHLSAAHPAGYTAADVVAYLLG
ncbi:nitronate monooxygenase [Actinomadura sp. ATCC 31491]|uniref:Nitronate monooxygenase n=1 Tax=Actinomadura luzonensis TaxID=2805427 RepID=A0ABT0G136_9ACTN|nr:nitronate monooxygenase [Actinomadura luzonensis]MCK2218314.1 nitronate monooxygenase [Actinomadura luzonensis]